MTLKDLLVVKAELIRFESRLEAAIVRINVDKFALHGCKETGAVKRAALDLKVELTKITN
jgi:hypothetical protein